MKKDKLYLFTFLSLLVVVYICGYFSMNYLVGLSTEQFLKIQIESSKREAKEMANLISYQAQQNKDKQVIINNVQKSIEKTDMQTGFICMFDQNGKEICHPDPARIGAMTLPNESYISKTHNEVNSEDFYTYLKNKTEGGGVRNFNNPEIDSEIIYLYPVKNTDWIIASHANLQSINKQVQDLKFYFILVYISTGALIVLLSFFMIRLFGSRYERKLEQKNETLFNEVLSLSKLNYDLTSYKSKLESNEHLKTTDISAPALNKKRILTNLKNEIVTLEIEQIAYIYMENTITYVKDINGKISTSNNSLEEIYSELDNTIFFRANRQFILAIKSIDKILKYGNNQLKIEVVPKSAIDVIISKNKAAEFKAWLNK
ncbi:LytTR family transcriptional regulator [Flavobacterium aquidurense]|uniref:Two-component system response regulator n=1 Tax=Flavobacterium aquidurense TaxID=362413 RepID=A0A0Q0WEM7_9FLAO|nr:LytTR family transcriptional regulator [Flavobacterium aquidurense]KQB42739.1 Two-component system response regulator [Flavobacterium aquidurense]